MTLTGKVISDPDKSITYTPLVDGVVKRVAFTVGEKVRKGQLLMEIRSAELSSLEAALIGAEGALAVARRAYRTAESMHSDGMLSERDLLEAAAEVQQAEAELEKVKADMSLFGTSRGKGTFAVTAPADGYIITRNVSAGSTLTAGDEPAFTIADLSSVWIIANVYASNLSFVREGMEAVITTLSYPGEEFPAQVTSLSQVFDPEDKALKARIVMPNPGLKLKPEMSVVIRLKEEFATEKTAVPSDALIFDNDTYFVVVETTAGQFEFRRVMPQGHTGTTTFLTGDLQPGEQVVVKNQLLIYSELKGK